MKTNEILPIENIRIGLQANNKRDLLKKMCELASKSGKIENLEEVKKKVIERENLMTTGIGQGVALPHAKTNAVKGIVGAFAKLKENIDFNSIDDKPVKYVYLLIGRENNTGMHLRVLSRASRILHNEKNISELDKCRTEKEILDFFVQMEEEE